MMLWLVVAPVALATEPPAQGTADPGHAEEIIVWGDRFLRWERRWHVETEVAFPRPFTLYGVDDHELRILALQLRVVLSCDKDFAQGRHQWEVSCTIEDIGLTGLTSARNLDAPRAEVLDQIDATMTGARIQIHASDNGGVPHVDLEGLATTTQRTRRRLESMRQLALRVMVPFQLKLPDTVRDGAQWYEADPRLMTLPSSVGSAGGSTVAHYLDAYDGYLLVQSIGRAVMSPQGGAEVLAPTTDGSEMSQVLGAPVDTYALDLHGVAIFDPQTGIMTERVWSVTGQPTASSKGTLTTLGYRHVGRLRMLGEQDRPHVGPTRLVVGTDWRPLQP